MNQSRPADSQIQVAIALELDHPYPWHHECYQGVLDYAAKVGWHCVVDPYLVGAGVGVKGLGYDGIIGRIGHQVADIAREQSIPVVNHWLNSPATDIPAVGIDQHAGSRLAADHMVSRGFREFAYVGYARDRGAKIDLGSFNQTLAQRGMPPATTFTVRRAFETDPDLFMQFKAKLMAWIESLPTPMGIFVSSTIIGRYLAQVCSEMGLRVPHDFAVVVQTGENTVATCSHPTLTLVEHNYFGAGYQAAILLDQIMRGEVTGVPVPVMVPPKRLVVRESSDTFITPDPLVTDAMRYIADNAGRGLSVDEVAEAVSTSRRTLERYFEQHLERSVYATITRFRTDFIKRTLVDSDAPLGAVAVDCGFASVSHFTEFFRKSAGITPSKFRKQMRRV